jgi:hypothetical protein
MFGFGPEESKSVFVASHPASTWGVRGGIHDSYWAHGRAGWARGQTGGSGEQADRVGRAAEQLSTVSVYLFQTQVCTSKPHWRIYIHLYTGWLSNDF